MNDQFRQRTYSVPNRSPKKYLVPSYCQTMVSRAGNLHYYIIKDNLSLSVYKDPGKELTTPHFADLRCAERGSVLKLLVLINVIISILFDVFFCLFLLFFLANSDCETDFLKFYNTVNYDFKNKIYDSKKIMS